MRSTPPWQKWRTTATVVALVAAADQVTKSLASQAGRLPAVLPVRNPALSLEVLHVRSGVVSATTAGALLGGALSNLVDRVLFGSVRDFLVLGAAARRGRPISSRKGGDP